MTPRRRWLVIAVAAALLLAWWSWPRTETRRASAVRARHAPAASARRAPPLASPRATPAPAFGAVKSGIAACDDYVARAIACDQLPDDAKIAIAEASKAWADSDERAALEVSCRDSAAAQAEALTAMGC